MIDPRTPVIVGVGQAVGRLSGARPSMRPAAELAAMAARRAAKDAGVRLEGCDAIVAIRTFADSLPVPSPFGKPDNFPRAVARRLNLIPREALLAPVGGDTPLTMLALLGDRIAGGELSSALLVSGEAIASERRALERGIALDWAEHDPGGCTDLGRGLKEFVQPWQPRHGLNSAALAYGLCETARRARLGLSRDAYALQMAALFAPFTRVAASNRFAADGVAPMDARALLADEPENRMIADPYRLRLVARDRVNQGAAILMMSVGEARARAIPPAKWLFVHGLATAVAPDIVERADLGAAPEAVAAIGAALAQAATPLGAIGHFDFYSCFPIAVFATAIDGLDLRPDDPRGLTVAGGLPAFGGPGNGYSMHALAAMASRLRPQPAASGLVVALGGFLSKFAAAVFAARPAPWPETTAVSGERGCRLAVGGTGRARLETYTIAYVRGRPVRAIVIGRFPDGMRFVANEADQETLGWLLASDPLGADVTVGLGDAMGSMVVTRQPIRTSIQNG